MSRGKGGFLGHDEISVCIEVIVSSISRKLQHTQIHCAENDSNATSVTEIVKLHICKPGSTQIRKGWKSSAPHPFLRVYSPIHRVALKFGTFSVNFNWVQISTRPVIVALETSLPLPIRTTCPSQVPPKAVLAPNNLALPAALPVPPAEIMSAQGLYHQLPEVVCDVKPLPEAQLLPQKLLY